MNVYYRAANAIFGKIGRFASEDVSLHLSKTKLPSTWSTHKSFSVRGTEGGSSSTLNFGS